MRLTVALPFVLIAIVVACGSPAPTPGPTLTPTVIPSAAPTLVPLPGNMSGIPGDDEPTSEISPGTPEELTVGEERGYTLGHCGLISPIDIDGSLWDPVGTAAALTDEHEGELINATPVVIVLMDENTMEMHTPAGAVITLTRNDGARTYVGCD